MEQNKSDIFVRCVECGEQFTITTSEIEWWHQRNLHLPKRCLECRKRRKAAEAKEPKAGVRDG